MERKRYSGEFKVKVAVEAIKGEKTASEIAGRIWGTFYADSAVEEAINGRDTENIFSEEGARCKKGGGNNVIVVSADRSIESGVRLG